MYLDKEHTCKKKVVATVNVCEQSDSFIKNNNLIMHKLWLTRIAAIVNHQSAIYMNISAWLTLL